jgi:hypothetical protein
MISLHRTAAAAAVLFPASIAKTVEHRIVAQACEIAAVIAGCAEDFDRHRNRLGTPTTLRSRRPIRRSGNCGLRQSVWFAIS